MARLNDSQLVILAAAAQRDEGRVLPLPQSLKAKGAVRANILKSLIAKGLIAEVQASRDDELWREDNGGTRLTLVLTAAGLEELGLGPDGREPAGPASPANDRAAPSASARQQKVKAGSHDQARAPARAPRQLLRQGKGAAVLALLQREEGASLAEMMEATGWQRHSVRGFLAGKVKKRLGLKLESTPDGAGTRRYRITG